MRIPLKKRKEKIVVIFRDWIPDTKSKGFVLFQEATNPWIPHQLSCIFHNVNFQHINFHVGICIIDALTDEILHGVCTIKALRRVCSLSGGRIGIISGARTLRGNLSERQGPPANQWSTSEEAEMNTSGAQLLTIASEWKVICINTQNIIV